MRQLMNAAPAVVNVKRRTFIGHTLATGVVAAIAGSEKVYAQATVAGCGQTSLADGLVIALSAVSQIATDAYSKLGSETSRQLTSCKDAFEELYSLLNSLCKELGKAGLTQQATRLRNLTEVGQANWQLINAGYSQDQNYAKPAFLTLAVVNQQLCAQAQDLPNTEWKLSKEASAILKRIVVLSQSDEFKALHKELTEIRDTSDERRTQISSQISFINQAILAARAAIILAENPNPRDARGASLRVNRVDEWRNADKNVVAAITKLKEMIDQKRLDSFLGQEFISKLPAGVLSIDKIKAALSQVTDDLTATDTLIMGLGTARRELRTPDHGFTAARYEMVTFIQAAYQPPLAVDRKAIGELLWTYCPPGSRDQIDKVDSVVAFVDGWNPLIPRPAREVLIRTALYWAIRFNRITCSGTGPVNLRMLAGGLAALV